MSMERWEQAQRNKGNIAGAEIARVLRAQFGDEPLPSVAASVEKQNVQTPEAPMEIQTLSKDQLILPETQLPQEVLDILQRAEKVGIGVFEAYHLSDVTLDKDSNVDGWDKKPSNLYWGEIAKGNISQDAPKLPGSWVLVDKTQRPDYKDGKQMYEKDPFGPLLKQLRKEKKIQVIKGIPEASRFGISPNELTQVVLPEIAKLLGVEASQVRSPKEIEFSIIGNLEHPEWGATNTSEWFDDKFGDSDRLVGGCSGSGGLADVLYDWSGRHDVSVGFRPLVVVSPSKT